MEASRPSLLPYSAFFSASSSTPTSVIKASSRISRYKESLLRLPLVPRTTINNNIITIINNKDEEPTMPGIPAATNRGHVCHLNPNNSGATERSTRSQQPLH